MATKKNASKRSVRPLTRRAERELAELAGLDLSDKADAAKADAMAGEVRAALARHPSWDLVLDAVRPANQLAAVRSLKKETSRLIAAFDALDDVTWRDVEFAYGVSDKKPPLTEERDGAIRKTLAGIREAVEAVQCELAPPNERTAKGESQRGRGTQAEQLLISELAEIYSRFARSDSARDAANFVEATLRVALPGRRAKDISTIHRVVRRAAAERKRLDDLLESMPDDFKSRAEHAFGSYHKRRE